MLSTKAILCQFFRDREAWKGLSEGKEQKELFCLSTYVCQRGPDACGFSSKVLCWYRQSHLTAPSVHFCFLTQPPRKIWCYSVGQSNQSVCHSWLVSPVVIWWTSCGVLLVWGFFLVVVFVWFCGFGWFWFVCLLAGAGRVGERLEGVFNSFLSALRKISLWNIDFLLNLGIPLVCPFCWINLSHFPGSSQYPLQSYIPGFCQCLLLQTVQNITHFLTDINRVIPQ